MQDDVRFAERPCMSGRQERKHNKRPKKVRGFLTSFQESSEDAF